MQSTRNLSVYQDFLANILLRGHSDAPRKFGKAETVQGNCMFELPGNVINKLVYKNCITILVDILTAALWNFVGSVKYSQLPVSLSRFSIEERKLEFECSYTIYVVSGWGAANKFHDIKIIQRKIPRVNSTFQDTSGIISIILFTVWSIFIIYM